MEFVSKTFIGPATAKDNTETDARGNDSIAKQVEDYISSLSPAGSAGAREIKVSAAGLMGDRVFVIVTVET